MAAIVLAGKPEVLGENWALSQEGAGGCKALTRNQNNIKHNHVNQSPKKRATPYRSHVLPLSYLRGGDN